MATRLKLHDLEDRVDCYGEFDRTDQVCLTQCGLNFECAQARERYLGLDVDDEALNYIGCVHSA